MAEANRADRQKQGNDRSSGVAEWIILIDALSKFPLRKPTISFELDLTLEFSVLRPQLACTPVLLNLGNYFNEQLAENKLWFELGGYKLNISFQTGLQPVN